MALLWLDSFEHYENTTENSGSTMTGAMERGNYLDCQGCDRHTGDGVRTGSRALAFDENVPGGSGEQESWAKKYIGDQTTVIVGFSFFVDQGSNQLAPIYRFWHDDGLGTETLQVDVRRTSLNGLAAYDGAGTLLGVSAPSVISLTDLNYVEAKVTIDQSAGEVVLRVNNCEVLNLQSIDTVNDSGAGSPEPTTCNVCGPYMDPATVGVPNTNETHVYDDYYICDGSGSVNNDFLGDITVQTLVPSGAGTFTMWGSESGGSPSDANYLNVDETPEPDEDTTYNWSNTTGAKDTYAMGDLPDGALEVFGVMLQGYVRKEIGGDKQFKLKVLLSSAGSPDEEIDSPGLEPTTSYAWHTHVFETKPGGGSWTPDDVNNMEAGVEISEGSPS